MQILDDGATRFARDVIFEYSKSASSENNSSTLRLLSHLVSTITDGSLMTNFSSLYSEVLDPNRSLEIYYEMSIFGASRQLCVRSVDAFFFRRDTGTSKTVSISIDEIDSSTKVSYVSDVISLWLFLRGMVTKHMGRMKESALMFGLSKVMKEWSRGSLSTFCCAAASFHLAELILEYNTRSSPLTDAKLHLQFAKQSIGASKTFCHSKTYEIKVRQLSQKVQQAEHSGWTAELRS